MTKNTNFSSLFELLCLNDLNQLSNFILEHGKGPKVICPIMFMDDENSEKESEEHGKI